MVIDSGLLWFVIEVPGREAWVPGPGPCPGSESVLETCREWVGLALRLMFKGAISGMGGERRTDSFQPG